MNYKTNLMLLMVSTVSGAGLAQAQQQPPLTNTSPSSAEASSDPSIGDIIVTAQRREESLQRAAAAVSVRQGTELQAGGKFALSAILEDVPGVTGGAAASPGGISGSSSGTDSPAAGLTIRGIPSNVGVAGSAVSIATSAALYVDGIYSGVGGSYDIEQVEVLRGPQGTLYGRSATSGVVAIHTRNPDLADWQGNAVVEFGNYDLQHYSGAVSAPLVEDKLALRISGNYYDRDGYDTHGRGGSTKSTDLRAKLLFQPTPDISVLLGLAGQNNKVYNSGKTFTLTSPNDYTVSDSPIGPGTNKFRQYWAELNWHLGGVDLTYQPAYRTWRSDALSYIRIPAINLSADQTISTPKDDFMTHELRLASDPGGKLSWQVGALYYRNVLENVATSRNGTSQALQYSSDTAKKVTAAGVFGEATYAFAEDWRINGGLRYDYTKVQVNQTYTTNLNLGGAFGGGPLGSETYALPEVLASQSLSGEEGRRRFRNVTYKARLEHDLTPDNLVYALTSTGFSPGDVGVTTGADLRPTSIVFDSETLTAYELGSKNRFFDNRLQLNGAFFYYVYGAFQVANINISTIPGADAFTALSAPARAYGGELELLFRPTHRDRIGLNLGYTKAYFVHAEDQVIDGTGGKTFKDYFARSGIPGVIPLVAQVNYDHDFEFASGSRLTLHGDVRYLSANYSTSLTQTQLDLGAGAYARTGGQFIGDLTATWISADGHISLSAYMRNVGDNRYKTGVRVDNGAPGTFSATTLLYDPRTYGLVLAAKF